MPNLISIRGGELVGGPWIAQLVKEQSPGKRKIRVIFAIDFDNIDKQPPVVKTRFGSIIGKWSKSSKGLNIANFLGIPYAEPPIGNLRFRKPKAWNNSWDVIEAQSDGPPCIQLIKLNTTIGSEDCLYLNVFVPAKRPDVKHSKHPVLVFIHGGAFIKGSSNSKLYPSTYWADQQIILVTFHYRLGPFGFFSLGNSIAPGNYGLKDMVMALKWVQQNIESFGGDRNSVTLMGSSSGAASIHILSLSKKTEGLFHKYILHSGTALTPWAVHSKHKIREASESIANYLTCPTVLDVVNSLISNSIVANDNNDIKEDWNVAKSTDKRSYKMDLEIIMCMRSFDAESILIALSHHYSQHKHPYCVFVPTIEDESSEAILTMHPIEIIEKKLFRDIPGIMGVVNDEGLLKTYDLYVDSENLKIFVDQFDTILPKFLEMPYVINRHGFVNAIKDFYFEDNDINTQLQKITEITSDGIFIWSVYKTMSYLSKVMKSNLYLFYFNYFGTFSNTQVFGSKPLGISHSDDIKYFFPSLQYDLSSNTKSDTIMIHVLTELWSNFIKKGVPSTWSVPNWPAYRNHHEFMLFNGNQEVNITIEKFDNYFVLKERMNFWNNLMYNYSNQFPKWYLYDENIHDKHNGCYQLQITNCYVYILTIFMIVSIYV
ncbi:PREDICTED: venom carboxylesterase-6-like isoform X2 [Polistes dominula]|uniref:Carboxylic ester hydrolase n=1 Tax=Polistes dominula TaxID=743375 RepID=A0ABM1I271_POLDO|nr:PREDICTED: venom carboxylesterase-6-like isoform X2 [Polistes dominula]